MGAPGRNDPCPCGSGRKYKRCCLSARAPMAAAPALDGARILETMQSALAHHAGGRHAQADELCRRILQVAPNQADALHLRGLIASRAGRLDEALDLIGRAVEARGSEPAFHCNLGRVHEAQGRPDAAAECYRRALAIDPDHPEANGNLGGILANRIDPEQAVALCRRAVEARPSLAAAWCNLGIAHYYRGELDLAEESCREALRRWPEGVEAWHILACTLVRQGRSDQAIEPFERALALRPDYARARDSLLFALLYRSASTPEEIFAAHRRYGERLEGPLRREWPCHANARDPGRRLRIGYVSPDLHRHSVAFFAEPLLARHDHGAFEVFCYYHDVVCDEVTERLRACADHWVDCADLDDVALAGRIAADGIDILVDLAGHSARNRLAVFARRPAPVQVTWLGYPATTGLTAMDYRLTGADLDPEGSEAYHTERLYRLPRSPWCYRPPSDAPAPRPREEGPVRFGSMNAFAKVAPEAVRLWARILRAVPDARLVMTHVPEGSARATLVERFAAEGVGAGRLELHGRLPSAEFHAVSARIDIALDPFPYNGTTTTCEALWLGIPVVTLTGSTSVSRSGHALLRGVGLDELCAPDEEGYVRIAAGLAADRARLEVLRAGMRARLEASPLRDEAGFARDVESAYRTLWRAWCREEAVQA